MLTPTHPHAYTSRTTHHVSLGRTPHPAPHTTISRCRPPTPYTPSHTLTHPHTPSHTRASPLQDRCARPSSRCTPMPPSSRPTGTSSSTRVRRACMAPPRCTRSYAPTPPPQSAPSHPLSSTLLWRSWARTSNRGLSLAGDPRGPGGWTHAPPLVAGGPWPRPRLEPVRGKCATMTRVWFTKVRYIQRKVIGCIESCACACA